MHARFVAMIEYSSTSPKATNVIFMVTLGRRLGEHQTLWDSLSEHSDPQKCKSRVIFSLHQTNGLIYIDTMLVARIKKWPFTVRLSIHINAELCD